MLRSSPTTTRAVNEKRRPPLTTLATRLISTTRSWRSWPWGPRPALSRVRSLLAMCLERSGLARSGAQPPERLPPAGGPCRGSGSRRGRTRRSLRRRPWPAWPAARRPSWPAPWSRACGDPPLSTPPRPACGRDRRRSAGPGRRDWSERRTAGDARRCRAPWLAPGGAGACGTGAWSPRSCALADLPGHVLALVADALALVGLGGAHLADARGHLAHLLL